MERFENGWLIVNASSGSNSPAALDELRQCLCDHAIAVQRTIEFPDDELPTPGQLDEAKVPLAIVYTGDGTLNAAIGALEGWSGAVLVLPGGTMNLLSKRLHGDRQTAQILSAVAQGGALRTCPKLIHCDGGDALAGLLAGPGTRWSNVREAMRQFDVAGIMEGAVEALAEVSGDALVRAAAPLLGRREGYPLIEMTPGEHGIQLDGFHAETAGEYAAQTWALLRRSFREGPHDRLGVVEAIDVETVDGSPLEILIDGEPATLPKRATFTVAPCGVDLLATGNAD